ncbi:MAG: site-specific tyrosine recombinase XerD [Actinomycetota bacterium]|nr:site-specific tyrosine recombinase XerD [Actinomycetota bacterium]
MREAIDGYLAHVSIERGLAANTVSAYRRDLERYGTWCDDRGIGSVGGVQENDVADFAASLRQGEVPLSASSAARVVVAVRTFHRFCAREGLSTVDPARYVRPPAIPRRLPKALPYEQVAAMIDGALDAESPIGLRDRALLEFLYGTGTRISEAVGLDVDDVDLETRTVVVTGKGSKQRLLPLGEFAVRSIDGYLVRGRPALATKGRGTPRLFLNSLGRALSRQSAYGVISAAAERAGVKQAVSPHTLRHSFATHLMQGGADVRVVQELLGHASVTTTQIYTMVTADTLREVYATSHPRAR